MVQFLMNMGGEQNLKITMRVMSAEYKRLNMKNCARLNFVIR
jgi:hypothetical protein